MENTQTFIGYFVCDTKKEAFDIVEGVYGIVWESNEKWHSMAFAEQPDYDTMIDIGLRHGFIVAVDDNVAA